MPARQPAATSTEPDDFGAAARLDGVPSALAAARDAIDALLRDAGLRAATAAVTAESLLRGATASAQLAGSRTTIDEARQGSGDELTRRTVRLYAGLLGLVPVVLRSPLEALARMHQLAAAGAVPVEQLGRPRPDPAAAALLRSLGARLLAPTTAPAIAVAALAHAEIVAHAPFDTGNDVVARALERLLLVSRGVDPASVTVPEAGHAAADGSYRAARSAYRQGGAAGTRAWLLHAATAMSAGCAASPLRSAVDREPRSEGRTAG